MRGRSLQRDCDQPDQDQDEPPKSSPLVRLLELLRDFRHGNKIESKSNDVGWPTWS